MLFPSFYTVNENCFNTVSHLCHCLGINVTSSTIQDTLTQHPDFPSLLSISDALAEWGVRCSAGSIEKKDLTGMPLPLIGHIETQGKRYFVVVREIQNGKVEVSHPATSRWMWIPLEVFEQEFTGIVMLVDSNDRFGERNYAANKRKEQFNQIINLLVPVVAVALWLSVSFVYVRDLRNWPAVLLLALKAAGTYIGILFLWYEVDPGNKILRRTCGTGPVINCNAILNSKAARPFAGLSWGEIGFFYFISGLVLLCMDPAYTTWLVWLNFLALPYVFFSVYYQWKVARQWCTLCLITQAILIAECVTGLVFHSNLFSTPVFPEKAGFVLPFVLISPVVGWYWLKPVWSASKENEINRTQLARLKNDRELFAVLLTKQAPVLHNPQGMGIVLGNPEAGTKIIQVCNPYCVPCASAHRHIDQLLDMSSDVQVQIIFAVEPDLQSMKTRTAAHLLALATGNTDQKVREALHDWYTAQKKDHDVFSAKYRVTESLEDQMGKIRAMYEWCNLSNIRSTPTFFVNGFQLPAAYTVRDMKRLLRQG